MEFSPRPALPVFQDDLEQEEQVEDIRKHDEEQARVEAEPTHIATGSQLASPACMDPAKWTDWIRRRVFEMRLSLGKSPAEFLAVLQSLEDDQLEAPFAQVKLLWGLEETEALPAAMGRIAMEFRTLRSGGSISPAHSVLPAAPTAAGWDSSAVPAVAGWGSSAPPVASSWQSATPAAAGWGASAGWRGGGWGGRS